MYKIKCIMYKVSDDVLKLSIIKYKLEIEVKLKQVIRS